MKNKSSISVYSEIENLKEVIVHRPGNELLFVSPTNMQKFLFSAIIELSEAQKEHDNFVKKLKENGVKVVYVKDLFNQTIKSINQKTLDSFFNDFIKESKISNQKYQKILFNFLKKTKKENIFEKIVTGITTKELKINKENDILLTDPMPNMYFTRDSFTCVGNSLTINNMKYYVRQRETLIYDFIFSNHSDYKNCTKYIDRNISYPIEGGDIFIINKDILMIGISERTSKDAILEIAKKIKDQNHSFKKIVCVNVPKMSNLMHLDTWLTMIDYDKFIYSPNILKELKFFEINLENKIIKSKWINSSLRDMLEKMIGKKVTLIPVAGNYSKLSIDIETHFDATNFLTIKPGVVIGYDRNKKTINELKKNGIKVIAFSGNQLSLGMGSARCMSMPLYRKK